MAISKRLKLSLALFAGLAIVLSIGYSWAHRPSHDQKTLLEIAARSQEVYQQYRRADYYTAKAALLGHIHYLDSLASAASDLNGSSYSVDAMIAYVRLAKLEEKFHRSAKSEYMKEACTRCNQLKWRDCSEEYLRRTADQMDR